MHYHETESFPSCHLVADVLFAVEHTKFNGYCMYRCLSRQAATYLYEGWNFNSGNYLFTTDTK